MITIKLQFESTNKNQLARESNLAAEVEIDNDEIKLPLNHRVSQMIDWQLARQPNSRVFLRVVIRVNETVKVLDANLLEAAHHD